MICFIGCSLLVERERATNARPIAQVPDKSFPRYKLPDNKTPDRPKARQAQIPDRPESTIVGLHLSQFSSGRPSKGSSFSYSVCSKHCCYTDCPTSSYVPHLCLHV